MAQPLSGIRVLDLSTGVAGGYLTKLLADFGADVIKVEPPEGDPLRAHGPFPVAYEGDLEQGALHLHLGTNKRSVVADLHLEAGRDLVRALVPSTDIVVESFAPGTMAGWGLGFEDLKKLRPSVVLTSVTPFGQDGPYAQFKGEEIVYYAMGGPMQSTGLAEREPQKLGGFVSQYLCGNLGAVATLAAHEVARRSGTAVHVDLANVETQASSIDRRVSYLLAYQFSGRNAVRIPGFREGPTPAGMFPASDGYVLILVVPTWIPAMNGVLQDAELAERYQRPGWMTDPELPDLVNGAVYGWLADKTKHEAMVLAQRGRWPITALNLPVDVLADPHFNERGFWADVAHPVAGVVRQPGMPFRLGDAWQVRRPAPLLGQHTEEVEAEARAPQRAPVPAPDAAGAARLPLEGVRVLDITVVWAGPAATLHLADLGAEVIRLDNPSLFPTATRGTMPRPPKALVPQMGSLSSYPDDDPGERPWNRHSMFSAHARNKLGATVDLRTPMGREMFLRLADCSDVVVENNSVDVMDKLGLGWEVLHARNPRLIVLRMPSLGLAGPYRSFIGFGAHFEALCGLTAIRGYTDLDPTATVPVFHMDPTSGATGAFAVMCALRRREATGEGELVELAQAENLLQHIGEYLIDAARTGRAHEPMGNRHLWRAPQGCYRCAGDDRWAVLSVGTDAEWRGLRRAMGEPAWSADARFDTGAGRRAHHDEIDAGVEAWTATLTPDEVFHRCQREGVAAGPVLDEAGCLADVHLIARGFFRENGSSDLGRFQFPRHPWSWDGPAMRWEPLSRLGADNERVWKGLVGVSDDEWAEMVAHRHIATGYLGPDGTPL